jgi:aryl-alcohol dehydrogenase-like predicted oxidoreductase
VDTVIIGARHDQQLRDNLAAASPILSTGDVDRLDAVGAHPLFR